jgi:hypothetical protein
MANFFSLANELQQIIFEEVPSSDFVKIRLVCKEFEANSSRTFVGRYFTEVAVTLTPTSLRRLHKLTSHIFGQSVQAITISTSTYTAESLRSMARSSKSPDKIRNHRQELYVKHPSSSDI